ncbi:abc transporter, transmembrane domain, type 1 [Trichoderma arundinaceum]|uniref:Abc transporter, transmembrane domain, type 1 n=1 Tax=Trichoderma arundinaceum TaxID=490622 RepID=A0A395NLN8_TRIAR|nr:abc transporter, transmembrane domain, type 1 [Trichoderma arundinaceum]
MQHQQVLGVVASPADEYGYLVLPLSIAGLAIVGLSSLPAVVALLSQIRNRTPKDNFYQDIDGTSTPEAIASFSNRWPKVALLLLSLTGFGTSVALSVLSTLRSGKDDLFIPNWLITAALAAIVLQATCISAHRSPVKSHDLGLWTFGSALISILAIILQSRHAFRLGVSNNDPVFILRLVSLAATILLLLASISIPRRPDIFHKDKPVDAQFTSSALSRYTWSWGQPLVALATKKGDLDEKDIPGPDHNFRARDLVEAWHEFKFEGPLLKNLLRAYLPRFIIQWTVTIARSFVGLGPFWAMLRVIELLERRSPTGERPMAQILAYIVSLAVFSLCGQWMQGWVNWYSMYKTSIPLRGQLSALIFEKSLKRKNVKMAEKETPKADGDNAEGEDDAKKPEEDTVLKSRQAIVNLVGVDVRHVSNLAAFQFFIISSLTNLFVYCGFLLNLIGFLPFAAGIVAWALVLPINTYATKFYMKYQAKLMKDRDAKLAIVNEALLGIRQIKFSALENQWENRIKEMREQELTTLKRTFMADSVLFACWVISPIFLAAASLTVYSIMHGNLTPSIAFVSISIFKSLEVTLSALPELLTTSVDTLVSIKRIDAYLSGPEMKRILSDGPDVAFDNATVSWPVDVETPEEERFILKNINLSFPAGELSVISGKTGTGKSLLLSAILGEVDLLEGGIYAPPTTAPHERNDHKAHPGNWILPGSVAYVAQTPWLESASFRDNILFGLPYVESRYQKVIEVCALKKDLEILPDGDKTELGANGINLSGGQKWRVTLARAIYSRAEILVMDDIFSAVDAHVGRHIFEKCISGQLCEGRTRILVTHHVALVQTKAKYLVELGEGTVLAAGLTSELAEDGTLERIKTSEQAPEEIQQEEAAAESSTAVNSEEASVAGAEGNSSESTTEVESAKDKNAKDFIEKETRDKGQVKSRIYRSYLNHSGGWIFWIVLAILFSSFEAGNLARNWWVKIWTGESDGQVEGMHAFEAEQKHGLAYGLSLQHGPFHVASGLLSTQSTEHNLTYYLSIYVALSGASGLVGTLRFIWSFIMSIKASRTLFNQILFTVLRTPLRWLDTVPVGRILNRLTSDFDIIDNRINMDFGMLLWRALGLLGVCVAAALVSPYILPMAFVLVIFATIVAKKYMAGARPMKRLESTSKSPVFEQFNATLSGVATLRAYQKTQVYVDRMHSHLDAWDSVSVYGSLFNRWMSFRMALIGTAFSSIVGIVVALSPYIDASMAGFTLAFAVDFSGNILMTLWSYTNLELDMNATERVIEYADLKTEPLDGEKAPAAWPTSGEIEVKDLVVGYAEDLPAVLRGVSFNVKNNERVGVIGRTGAGKSSLTLALFRFLEARSGTVFIDGLDISKIDLHSLRSRLAIIPQDPVLFSGTIRSNLDPFNERTDEELRESLHRVHLVDSQPATPANEPSSAAVSTASPVNANIFRDLSSGIAESGGNLSQGQRQLLCMARAIVSRPKIMVLDEATSAVDMATDALIQRSIREEFTDSTLIVIAHRLSTIADFDRILVLSEGAVAEFGTPKELWEKEGGVFRDMCESSGEKDKLRETILGK